MQNLKGTSASIKTAEEQSVWLPALSSPAGPYVPVLIAKTLNVTTVSFKLMTSDAMAYATSCMQISGSELTERKWFRQNYSRIREEKLLLLVSGISVRISISAFLGGTKWAIYRWKWTIWFSQHLYSSELLPKYSKLLSG